MMNFNRKSLNYRVSKHRENSMLGTSSSFMGNQSNFANRSQSMANTYHPPKEVTEALQGNYLAVRKILDAFNDEKEKMANSDLDPLYLQKKFSEINHKMGDND